MTLLRRFTQDLLLVPFPVLPFLPPPLSLSLDKYLRVTFCPSLPEGVWVP